MLWLVDKRHVLVGSLPAYCGEVIKVAHGCRKDRISWMYGSTSLLTVKLDVEVPVAKALVGNNQKMRTDYKATNVAFVSLQNYEL